MKCSIEPQVTKKFQFSKRNLPSWARLCYLERLSTTVRRDVFDIHNTADPWLEGTEEEPTTYINLSEPEWIYLGDGVWQNDITNQQFSYL